MALNRRSSWVVAIACVIAGAATTLPAQTLAQATTPEEYQLKAVFLFNFAQFVQWPSEAFATAGAPLVIGVLGEDPFGDYLDETVRGEVIENHPLTIQHYSRMEDVTNCHILFISRSELNRLQQVLGYLKGRSILTVGDVEGFARGGGMIRFVTEHNRIRLRINLSAAESANLKLSSKLLRPATIVTTGMD